MQLKLLCSKLSMPLICISAFFFALLLLGCSTTLSDEDIKKRYDKALEAKNWKTVIELLDEIIERHPDNKESYYSRAIAKSNINPKDLKGVAEDLSTYLTYNPKSYQSRYIRFQAYSILNQFDKALIDIDKIIELKGRTSFLLAWKGNCAFAAKKFDVAEQCYEERLRLAGSSDDLRNTYYYWVFSKYFEGNKKAAVWDVAFLENRGFKENNELLKLIEEDKLVFEDIANFQLPQITLEQLDEMLNNFCSDLDIFQSETYFRPQLLSQFYRVEQTKDLKQLIINKEDVFALNIAATDIDELPKELSQFINLQFLNISGNRFKDKTQLFEDLSKLPNLKFLFANRCNFRVLPDNIGLLKNLEVLNLEANGLRVLNEHIGKLTKLKYLSLRNNSYLKDLPESIGSLRCLQFLNVSGGGMTRLRNELSNCSELVSILANASKIKTLPEQIGNLINLKYLNLGYNKIEIIPASIGKLPVLENLSLGSNEISKLPKEIGRLKTLKFLSLEFNRFNEFPREVLELDHVYNLWLHNSRFKIIPPEIGEMESLTHLLIDHQIVTDDNIEAIKKINPTLRVIREDTREYVKGIKRKQ
ncbi:hypothetical protein A9Q86_14950 [Flavobacteriales bacterium 33_180_T64]|nr:hypothetical protein A9Q86_14950 [Flavobacteriales bacterium 33_180_T64]